MPPKKTQAKKTTGNASDSIMDAIRSAFGKDAAQLMSDGNPSEVKEVIPTGIEVVDRHLLGCGGFPVGRITELYGESGTGKTSLVLATCAQAQAMGGTVLLADTENALATERAETFGVDLSRLILLQPSHLEETLAQIETCLTAIPDGAPPTLLVWDSIAATPTKAEVEEGIAGSPAFDSRAKLLSKGMRRLAGLASQKRAALILVNQVREKIGIAYGDKWVTPGGQAVKFTASIRIQTQGGKAIKKGDQHIGKEVNIRTTKNRMHPPFRTSAIKLDYEFGWDDRWTTLSFAKDAGLVPDNARGNEWWQKARIALGWAKEGDKLPLSPESVDGDTSEE